MYAGNRKRSECQRQGEMQKAIFMGTMSSNYDVDYFHVDTSSQILSRRPVIVNMEMPKGADYDLTVYDEQGNQVGMAVRNEDGTKTLVIPCDWSNWRRNSAGRWRIISQPVGTILRMYICQPQTKQQQ